MNSAKIIIRNQSKATDTYALFLVNSVVGMGLISETAKGKQYCFVTQFETGYLVVCEKRGSGTQTFTIMKG